MLPARLLLILGLPCVLLGCPSKEHKDVTDAGSTALSVDAGAAPASSSDEVEPVYAIDPKAPIDPLAQKLCAALSEMPEKKRATCCSTTPGIVVTPECARMLSAAMKSKAVDVSPAAVDACVAAFEKTLDGCDWVGPFPPGPPKECQNILKGTLGEGARCRSSLECAESMRCRGVGPTTAGKCTKARMIGELCGGTTDTLATFVRQNDLDAQHPECVTGHCINHRCATPFAAGEVCHVTLDCAEGLQCLPSPAPAKKGARPERKCTPKPIPSADGEACPGGVCGGDLQCVLGKCARRKNAGEECSNDFECRGGCVKADGGTKSVCGPRCDIR